MKSSDCFAALLAVVIVITYAAFTPAATAATTLYVETYQGEPGFPTTPEVDVLGLGGMSADSRGSTAVAPPLPVLTGDRVSVNLVSTGIVPPTEETASTFVDARPLLASGVPFEVTGHFENLNLASGSLGFVTMLLTSSTTGYLISGSLYVYFNGTTVQPSMNIAEAVPGSPIKFQTVFLPGVPVTSGPFDVTLVVDPSAHTAMTRLLINGLTYEIGPFALDPSAIDTQQPDALTQTAGIDNRYGAGRSDSVDFREFRVRTPLIRADIDVKPGDERNVINIGSRGTTPVAIFSTRDFDATTIAPGTVFLAGAPVARTPRGEYLCRPVRLNRDRRADLVCQIVTAQIDAPLGESVVKLKAIAGDGSPVIGEDEIRRVR